MYKCICNTHFAVDNTRKKNYFILLTAIKQCPLSIEKMQSPCRWSEMWPQLKVCDIWLLYENQQKLDNCGRQNEQMFSEQQPPTYLYMKQVKRFLNMIWKVYRWIVVLIGRRHRKRLLLIIEKEKLSELL